MNKFLSGSCFAVILVTLYLGLNFKNATFKNTVSLDNGKLSFSNNSFAILSPKLEGSLVSTLNDNGFVIDLDIFPEDIFSSQQGNVLRMVSNGDKENSFNLFFWKNQFIVLVGDDFGFYKKDPRVGVELESKKYSISIRASCNGLRVFINDTFVKQVKLKEKCFKFNESETSIFFGGGLLSEKSWSGNLYLFSLSTAFDDAGLNKKIVDYDFSLSKSAENTVLYDGELLLPNYPVFHHRQLFRADLFPFVYNKVNLYDVAVNFFWFSIVSVLFFIRFRCSLYSIKSAFYISLIIPFCLSLFIEYWQSWLPMRDSSLRDLFLNCIGGFFGSLFAFYARKNVMLKNKFSLR